MANAVNLTIEPLEQRTMLTATPLYWDPTGAATASGGAGTWDTTTAEWRSGSPTGSLVAWNNTGDANGPYQAVFPASGGSVSIGVGVTASSVSFTAAGYSLSGSTLTLAGGTGQIDVASGISDTIAAPLAGSTGLTKTSAGTVLLTGANTYTGGTKLAAGTLNINSDSALGAVPSSPSTNITFTGTAALQAGASAVSLSGNRKISIGSGLTATLDTQSNMFTINGSISNTASSGALAKGGSSGTLVLGGANSFASGTVISLGGGTNVGAGMLELTNSAALGSNPITVDGHYAQNAALSVLALSGGITIGSNVSYLVGGRQPGGNDNIDLNSLSGNNTFNGTFIIDYSGGNYAVASSDASGTLTLGGTFTDGVSLTGRQLIFEGAGNGVISGSISDGSGSIATVFSGNTGTTWTLTHANSYSAGTTISSGLVNINADAALGTAPASPATNISFTGSATLQAGAAAVTLSANRKLSIGSGATATLDTQGDTFTINGTISNADSSGALDKGGTSGTLVLGGANSFASGTVLSLGGGTNVGAGILELTNGAALGSNPITVDGHYAQNAALSVLALSGGITIGSNVSYLVGGRQPGGNDNIDLNSLSGNNTFNGTFIIDNNGGNNAIASSDPAGTLTLGGTFTEGVGFTGRQLIFEGAGNGLVSGSINDGSGSIGTFFSGNAGTTWTMSGTNTYSQGTTVSTGVVVSVPQAGSLGSGAIVDNGLIQFNASSSAVASTLSDSISGTGSLVLYRGTLALAGSNTYGGGTAVSGGALLASNSTGSATGSGAVTVANGAILGGAGTVSGSVNINSGGTLAPGNAGVGTLNTGTVNLASGSYFNVVLNSSTPGSGFGQLNVIGSVNLNSAAISLTGTGSTNYGDQITLINNDGADAVGGTFSGLTQGASILLNGVNYTISYSGGTGNDVVLTDVTSGPPTGLIANTVPTNSSQIPSSIQLNWTASASANVVGYNIYRGAQVGGENYSAPINGSTLVTGTSFTDSSNITVDTAYYYTVEAVYSGGASSTPSNEASAFRLAPGWSDADLGQPTSAGNASFGAVNAIYSPNKPTATWVLNGGGTGLGLSSDQLNFASQPINTDATISALATRPSNSSTGGLIFRSTTTASSAYAAVVVTSGGNVELRWRDASGASSNSSVGSIGSDSAVWLKLVRVVSHGVETYSAYYSAYANGTTWTLLGTCSIQLAVTPGGPVLTGMLAASGGSGTQPMLFENMELWNDVPQLLTAAANIDIGGSSSTGINLSWMADAPGATGFEIDRQASDGSFQSLATVGLPSGSNIYETYTDTDTQSDTAYTYQVRAVYADGSFSQPTNSATATTAVVDGTYSTTPVATVSIPVAPPSGVSAEQWWSDVVSSGVSLQAGVHYEIVASGSTIINPQTSVYADADWSYTLDQSGNPQAADFSSSFNNRVNYGVGVNDTGVVNGEFDDEQTKVPYWGTFQSSHTYAIDLVGTGQPVSFNFHDEYFWDNINPSGAAPLQIQIFAANLEAPVLTATPDNTDQVIQLSWQNSPSNAASFTILRSQDGQTWTQLDQEDAPLSSYEDDSADAGVTYQYQVQVTDSSGQVVSSNIVSATLSNSNAFIALNGNPGTVAEGQQFTINAIPSGFISNSLSYQWTIQRIDDGIDDPVPVSSSAASVNLSLSQQGTYSAYVTATDGTTTTQSAVVVFQVDPLSQPQGLTATESNSGEVDLSWSPSDLATLYVITVTPTGGTPVSYSVDANTSSFAVTGLTPDQSYSFSVQAQAQSASGSIVSSDAGSVTAFPSSQSLLASGPTTVLEDSVDSLVLTSGSPSTITNWSITWTDGQGNLIVTDTLTGSSGEDAYPTSYMPKINAVVTAYDSTGASFKLPLFSVNVIPPDALGFASGPNCVITGDNISTTANQAFNGEVATFTSSDTASDVASYTASIDWGDGNVTAGTIQSLGNGNYQIIGSHTYTQPGAAPLLIAVDNGSGDPAYGLGNATTSDVLTIANPASATLEDDNVTVDLSALGDDAAGPDQITYSWSVTGPNATGVIFDDNDDNNAQETFATLAAAGTYDFTVTMTNPNGQSVTSDMSISVAQVTTDLNVTAPSTSVVDGQSIQLNALVVDQFGNPTTTQPAVTWSVPGYPNIGQAVSPYGLYTAPSSYVGTVIVNASAPEVVGSIQLDVTSSAEFSVTINAQYGSFDIYTPPTTPDQDAVLYTKYPGFPNYLIYGYNGLPLGGSGTAEPFTFRYEVYTNGALTYSKDVNINSPALAGYPAFTPPTLASGLWGGPKYLKDFPHKNGTSQSVQLVWENNYYNATGVLIERSSNGGAFQQMGSVGPGVDTFTDSNPPAGVSLRYEVEAYNSSDNTNSISDGSTSPSDYAVNVAPIEFPVSPTQLNAQSNNSNGSVDLSWTVPNPGGTITGYEVQWSSDDSNFYTIDTVPAADSESNQYTYTDDSPTVNGNATNYYRVVAYQDAYNNINTDSGAMESSPSPVAQAVVVAAPIAVDDTDGGDNADGTSAPYHTRVGETFFQLNQSTGVLANDYDLQGLTLHVVRVNNVNLSSGSATVSTQNGHVTLDADGTFIYDPNAGFSGVDSFTYVASNGTLNSDPAEVDIDAANAPVVTSPDTYYTSANQTLTESAGALGANDSNPDGSTVTYSLAPGSAGVAHGSLTLNSDGSFTYVPNTGYAGLDSFVYQVTDGHTTSNPSMVVLSVGTAHYTMPSTTTAPTSVPALMSTFPNSLQGLWDSWQAAHDQLGRVAIALQNFGQAAAACKTITPVTAGTPAAEELIDSALAAQAILNQTYNAYTLQQQAAVSLAGQYMRVVHVGSYFLNNSVYQQEAINAISALPTDVMGIGPNQKQLNGYRAAFENFANGADFMVANNTFAVQVAQDTHDALELAIQAGGVASIGITAAQILTQQGCALFVQYALQQIENTAVSIAIAQVSQNAISLAARFSNLNINPDYLRIGADAFQLFSLVEAAKAQNLASKSGCFSGTTLVDTTNHGEQDINNIYLGERVQTSVAETPAQGGPAASMNDTTAVDPATWRQVNLTMPNPDVAGDSYNIQLLEPLSWMSSNNATIGSEIDLNLPEMGISGEAEVTSITTCPTIESGSGQVVLGTFEHISNDVVDVNLVGESQPLLVTANHPLWSLDTRIWVEAGQLYTGEHLAGANGSVTVASVTPDSRSIVVYNLDVENDHRYLVTDLQILAHNTCPTGSNTSGNDAGFRVVPRQNMDETAVWTKDEQISTIYGQASSSSTTTGHAAMIEQIAGREAASGEYDYVTIQRSVRTTIGRQNSNSTSIPDVVGVQKNGTVDIWEVMSKTDTSAELYERADAAMATVSPKYQGQVYVINPTTGAVVPR